MGFLENLKRSVSGESNLPGSEKDRYRLQKKLGSGAMGEVWLATDTLLNRPVAIKYLKSTQSRNKALFLSEAQLLARLNHPHITLIYDAIFDEKHNDFFLVMEYVEGNSLLDLINEQNGPMPLERVLEVTVNILQALQYAHGQGIVHRDIKPANVIMQGNKAKLTDFGVAGLMSLLAEGQQHRVGTPTYMPPEQILGQPVDGRADLYSLGVMLFAMASGGQLPFKVANSKEMYEAHLHQTPRPLRLFCPDVPVAFERASMRLLGKQAGDRYPSAGVALEVFSSIQARHKFSQPYFNLLDAQMKPLVGRSDELARLGTIWSEATQTAQPSLVVVRGDQGIGKSKLVQTFLGQRVVDKGQIALTGRSDETATPYAPFGEILAMIINQGLARQPLSEAQLNRLVEAISNLSRLLHIDSHPPAGSANAGQPPVEAVTHQSGLWQRLDEKMAAQVPAQVTEKQQALFSIFLEILTGLGPTVLYLEDAANLDESSITLARFLIGQSQLPLLLVAACREADPAWYQTFTEDRKIVIPLAPLSISAVNRYLANELQGTVSETVVETVMSYSRGVPSKMEEITQRLLKRKEIARDKEGKWRYVAKEIEAPPDTF